MIVCNIKFNNTHGKTPINRTPIYRKPRKKRSPNTQKIICHPIFCHPMQRTRDPLPNKALHWISGIMQACNGHRIPYVPYFGANYVTSTDRVQFLLDDKPCDPIIEIMIYCSSWFTSPFSVHPNFAVKRSFPVLLYYYNLAAISIKLASKLHVLVLLIFVPSSAVRPHSCNW